MTFDGNKINNNNKEDDSNQVEYRRNTLDLTNMEDELREVINDIESAENKIFVKKLLDRALTIVERAFSVVTDMKLQMLLDKVQDLSPSAMAKEAKRQTRLEKEKEKKKEQEEGLSR